MDCGEFKIAQQSLNFFAALELRKNKDFEKVARCFANLGCHKLVHMKVFGKRLLQVLLGANIPPCFVTPYILTSVISSQYGLLLVRQYVNNQNVLIFADNIHGDQRQQKVRDRLFLMVSLQLTNLNFIYFLTLR